MSDLRFTDLAAQALRQAIRQAGGVEVFAVGDVDEKKRVVRIEVHARGTSDAVLALQSRPRAGQVVIHNHPSGDLRPSAPDTELAGTFGENGVGFIIVDSPVTRSNWIVEPHAKRATPVDPDELRDVFERRLPTIFPGWEPRPGQLDLALRVAATLHDGGVTVLEAGTGTGKSLGYLVPAALWALANDAKVMVSTYTRTLQAQLVGDDLPTVARLLGGGLTGTPEAQGDGRFRYAILKGRHNYLCRRKLGIALDEWREEARSVLPSVNVDPGAARFRAALPHLEDWARSTLTGDLAELSLDLDEDDWDRIESDADQTLRARCPHFNSCFYYQARRQSAAAHLTVVNHALLLRDLATKAESNGVGILPAFDRVVLDEAHHLEEAATSAGANRMSALTLTRAIAPVLSRPGRPGALDRLAERAPGIVSLAGPTADALTLVRDTARAGFEMLGHGRTNAERVVGEAPHADFFVELAEEIQRACARIGAVEAALDEVDLPASEAQPLLDLGRARRRLLDAASVAEGFLAESEEWCRYLDPGKRGIAAARAPIDVAGFVRAALTDTQESVVLTSATLAVNGSIEHYLTRTGLDGAAFATFPSPFDYARQAVLAMPKDVPRPDEPAFLDVIGDLIVDAIRISRGGAFVLCTSHEAVRQLSMKASAVLGAEHAILAQGRGARDKLLERFRGDPSAVLFGTDSFWEGVSVRGDGLRLVIIPRLPFRVPTEPVSAARHDRLKERGQDPFRAYALPEAVLKLRQGFGRLVRSGTDRGAVLILDRRIHEMWYGRVFLASLPPARRVVGPSRAVMDELRRFYADMRG